jgi:glycosyltransferase involved in cell wall biosynthesis
MFFRAARRFLDQNPQVRARFAVIGDGELRNELEAYCDKNGLSGHVTFCGWMRDLPAVYADTDILALTSLNEGTPVSIIEAMASSVPVIATDAGGVLDLLGLQDGIPASNGFMVCDRGILCRKDDDLGFAKGMKYLAEADASLREELTRRGRSFVKEKFSEQRLLRDMESLYLELMGKDRNPFISEIERESNRCRGETF